MLRTIIKFCKNIGILNFFFHDIVCFIEVCNIFSNENIKINVPTKGIFYPPPITCMF